MFNFWWDWRGGIWNWSLLGVIGLNLSLPKVSNFKFPLQPHPKITSHGMKNLAFHSLLRWKMIVIPIIRTSLIHFSIKGWENVLFELSRFRARWKVRCSTAQRGGGTGSTVPQLNNFFCLPLLCARSFQRSRSPLWKEKGCRQNRTEENRTEQCRQTERSSGNPWYCLIPEQINLGNMYYNGIGVERDISKAKELYSQAAKTNKNAQLLLQELEEEMARPKDTWWHCRRFGGAAKVRKLAPVKTHKGLPK